MVLNPKLDKLLQTKAAENRHVYGDDTTVVGSVNHRSEVDVMKQSENLNINWSLIETWMTKWGELSRYSKKI